LPVTLGAHRGWPRNNYIVDNYTIGVWLYRNQVDNLARKDAQ
jgi:hypothetical protein